MFGCTKSTTNVLKQTKHSNVIAFVHVLIWTCNYSEKVLHMH